MMIILNLWTFKLSDIDQGIHKHAIQKKKESSAFLKKKIWVKRKKLRLSYPGLRYAHKKLVFACKKIFFSENVCLRTKFDLRLKKNKK